MVPGGSGRFRVGSGWFRQVPVGSGWVPRFTYTHSNLNREKGHLAYMKTSFDERVSEN